MHIPVLPILLAAATPLPVQSAPAPASAPAMTIARDVYGRWFAAIEAGDADATLALLAPGFVVKGPGGPPVSDPAAYREALAALHRRVRQQVQWRVEEAGVAGDWGWTRVSETTRHLPVAGGAGQQFSGSHLAILRRIDGRWLIHRVQMALDGPPVATAP